MDTIHGQPSSTPQAPPGCSVPKWPFFLGDFLLVDAALAVWATQSQLSLLETLFCLGAVGLGAVLCAFPFACEFFAQARLAPPENEQARAGEYQRLAALEGDFHRQARAATEALEQATRANAALEASARRFETRLAPLVEIQKKLETAVAELREAAARPQPRDPQPPQREWERLREDQAEKFKSADTKLAALGETLGALAAQIEKLSARPSPPAAAPHQVEETPSAKKPEYHGSLLAKALATVQPAGDSPAVADIIQSRPRRPRKPKISPEAPDAARVEDPAPVESGDHAMLVPAAVAASDFSAANILEPGEAEGWDSLAAGKFDTLTAVSAEVETSAVATAVADEPSGGVEAPPAGDSVAEVKRSARAKAAALRAADPETETPAASNPGVLVAQTELLPSETEATRKRRAAKPATDAATLVARILIGIGNKPYVRGVGPGLSPDKGVPMEFVEIGRWRWVAPASTTAPITLRILKNDEVPARGEAIVLKPGQSVEVSPVFVEEAGL